MRQGTKITFCRHLWIVSERNERAKVKEGVTGRGAEVHFRKVETVDGPGTWGLWASYTLAKTICCLPTVRGKACWLGVVGHFYPSCMLAAVTVPPQFTGVRSGDIA